MATITGMTAAAMSAIRDKHIVSADFDAANHLILTKYDGTTIDAGVIGTATATLQGVVELATSAETITGTDATRAVTPAGLLATKVLAANAVAEAGIHSSYPAGISVMDVSGWSLGSGFGTVVTENVGGGFRCAQTFYSASGGTSQVQSWIRHFNSADGGGGWTAWRRNLAMASLTAGSFTQATVLASYPDGYSRLYYTSGTSGSWDFTGLAGEVVTYRDSSNNFGRQLFTQHSSGSSNKPVVWVRTSDTATGWSGWNVLSEAGVWTSYTPAWTTSSGSATPSYGNAVVSCYYTKTGRKVEGWLDITFGNTTNFGSSPTGADNWLFSLPVAAARIGASVGWVELRAASNTILCMGRMRTNNANTVLIDVVGGRSDAVAITAAGDVDSVSPWTWGNGHSVRGNFVYESAA